MSNPERSNEGQPDFEMAEEMANAAKPHRDKALELRQQVDEWEGSKNPIKIVRRRLAEAGASKLEVKAESYEKGAERNVRRDRRKLEFYETLKGSEQVHQFYTLCAERAEGVGDTELAESIRRDDTMSAEELAAEANMGWDPEDLPYRERGEAGLLEEVASHIADEHQPPSVEGGLSFSADTESVLRAMGFSETIEDYRKKFDDGQPILLRVPDSNVAMMLETDTYLEQKPYSSTVYEKRYIYAIVFNELAEERPGETSLGSKAA